MLILLPNFGLKFFLFNKILRNDLLAFGYLSKSVVLSIACRLTIIVYMSTAFQRELLNNNGQYFLLNTHNILKLLQI